MTFVSQSSPEAVPLQKKRTQYRDDQTLVQRVTAHAQDCEALRKRLAQYVQAPHSVVPNEFSLVLDVSCFGPPRGSLKCCYHATKYVRVLEERVVEELKALLTPDQLAGELKTMKIRGLVDYIGTYECLPSEKDPPLELRYVQLISEAGEHEQSCFVLASYRCIQSYDASKTVLSRDFIYLLNCYFYAQKDDKPECCSDVLSKVPAKSELIDELHKLLTSEVIARELAIIKSAKDIELLKYIALMEMMPSEYECKNPV